MSRNKNDESCTRGGHTFISNDDGDGDTKNDKMKFLIGINFDDKANAYHSRNVWQLKNMLNKPEF